MDYRSYQHQPKEHQIDNAAGINNNNNNIINMPQSTTTTSSGLSTRQKSQIISKISSSRLTIIIGPTGSGKSTQIPPFLLSHFGGPILITQPRRLAVVAVSSRVSLELSSCSSSFNNTTTNNNNNNSPKKKHKNNIVGYHIGQSNLSTSSTQLLFTTAGILLEDLLQNSPLTTFSKYKCVIIDECHERSPESEIVLAIMRSFMTSSHHSRGGGSGTRFILMSATFDHDRYGRYFEGVPGCESRSSIVNLESAGSFARFVSMVETNYLEEVYQWLHSLGGDGGEGWLARLARRMRLDPDGELEGNDEGRSISREMLWLIELLVCRLNDEEEDGGIFVIFAPTYRHLEQIYNVLLYGERYMGYHCDVKVLHSSVDIDDCLRTMGAKKALNGVDDSSSSSGNEYGDDNDGRRRVLLASAIADSSVTIPNVTVVIDLCRALEVKWDIKRRKTVARTVWASKSVCDQRKGRTGRTCHGRVYRLIPQGHYINSLSPWDEPQLSISSCRDQILSLVCSQSKLTSSDPRRLLNSCLDPPPSEVLEDGVSYLCEIGACRRVLTGGRRRRGGTTTASMTIIPNDYGALLAAVAMSVIDTKIVVEGARLGLLHEILVLRAICSHKPMPIVHHFGEDDLNRDNRDKFFPQHYYYSGVGDSSSSSGGSGGNDRSGLFHHATLMANLSAYIYWDVYWNNGKRRRQALSDFFNDDHHNDNPSSSHHHDRNVWERTPEREQNHNEWCREMGINPTSVHSIAEIVDATLNVFFKSCFEPEWLRCANPTPVWQRCDDWRTIRKGGGGGGRIEGRWHDEQQQRWRLRWDSDDWDDDGYTNKPFDMLTIVYGEDNVKQLSDILGALCRQKMDDATQQLALSFVERREEKSSSCWLTRLSPRTVVQENDDESNNNDVVEAACPYFLAGNCSFGSDCRLSHSYTAKRKPCRFFARGECMRGDRCIFAHEDPVADAAAATCVVVANDVTADSPLQSSPLKAVAPLLPSLSPPFGYSHGWFSDVHDRLLLLGDGTFRFHSALTMLGMTPKASSTFRKQNMEDVTTPPSLPSSFSSHYMNVDATRIHLNKQVVRLSQSGIVDHFSWNFPLSSSRFNEEEEDVGDDDGICENESLLRGAFCSLALLFRNTKCHDDNIDNNSNWNCTEGSSGYGSHRFTVSGEGHQLRQKNKTKKSFSFAITLQGDQLSRWNVLRSALRVGWRLASWCEFDYNDFPSYVPLRENGDRFPVSNARFYVFEFYGDEGHP